MEDMFTWTKPTVVIHHTPDGAIVLSNGVRRDRLIINVPLRKFPHAASIIAVETGQSTVHIAAGYCSIGPE